MKKVLMKKYRTWTLQKQKNRKIEKIISILKMVNKYYQSHKEKIPKETRKKYQNFSEEEKVKRRKKAQERLQNFTEE